MGLASAQWYQCPMPRKRLKELMQRRDAPAIRDSMIWFASFVVSGGLAFYFWPTWMALPFFLIYGVLYGSSRILAGMNAAMARPSRPAG
jgi:fatty acid desaturase